MTVCTEPTPPAVRRQLGPSRSYAKDDLPKRLAHWHAPRANRWERLCVADGELQVQWLDPDGIRTETLHAGDSRWIAPGMRWRVTQMAAQARFQLEIHADDAAPVSTPQPMRAAWLDEVTTTPLDNSYAFTRLLADLVPGQQRLVRGGFDLDDDRLRGVLTEHGHTLFWHPKRNRSSIPTCWHGWAPRPMH